MLFRSPDEVTFRQTVLSYGTYPVKIDIFANFDDVLKSIRAFILKNKLAEKNDKVVIASGMPFGKVTETNMMVVETI